MFPFLLLYGALILMIYADEGFADIIHFSGPGQSGLLVFGVLAVIVLMIGTSALGGINSVKESFSIMAGGKWYNVYADNGHVSFHENGIMGIATLVLNFFKCLIVAPFKLIAWFVILPIAACAKRGDSFTDFMTEKVGTGAYWIAIICFIAAIILSIPQSAAIGYYQRKYDLDKLSIYLSDYAYADYGANGYHTFRIAVDDDTGQLESIRFDLVIVLDDIECAVGKVTRKIKESSEIEFRCNVSHAEDSLLRDDLTTLIEQDKLRFYISVSEFVYKHGVWSYNHALDGVDKRISVQTKYD